MDFSFEDALSALDATVQDCLLAAGVECPPVDPQWIVDRLQIVQIEHMNPDTRGSAFHRRSTGYVSVRPEQRTERWNWSLAHEIGELHLPEIERRLRTPKIIQPQREAFCDAFASRLLLPTHWFERDCFRLSFDLPKLKARYSTASNEVIARRMLEVDAPALITVWDGNVRGWRKPNPRTPVQDVERRAQAKAHRTGKPVRISDGPLTADAWPIHEGSRKREIVRLTWDDTA